jgi:hypothetical protein
MTRLVRKLNKSCIILIQKYFYALKKCVMISGYDIVNMPVTIFHKARTVDYGLSIAQQLHCYIWKID